MEILVVAGIVAILAAIIASVFVGVKGSAKKTSCINNLSQIGKSLLMYAWDNNGLAPPYMTKPMTHRNELEAFGNAELWRNALFEYAKSKEIFYCPADSKAKTAQFDQCADKANSFITSYETTPVVNGEINSDKTIIVSIDNPKFENISYLQDRVCLGRDLKDGSLTFKTYHGDMMSVLFLDGHVKYITITDKK